MRRYSLSFLLLVLFLLACQVSKEEKIYQILNRRQEALQKRDLSLYFSYVSKDDQDKEEDFNRLERRIDGYFNAFDRITYSSWERFIHVEGETATVIQQFHPPTQETTALAMEECVTPDRNPFSDGSAMLRRI